MLAWYAERLPAVEINNTFYRMPGTTMLRDWVETTPEDFRFAIKASRRITHIARLKDTATDSVDYLYRQLAALGDKRGPVLFQLPPNLKKDLPRLLAFLQTAARRSSCRIRIPQRHLVRRRGVRTRCGPPAPRCASPSAKTAAPPPLVRPRDWGYVRLRLEEYSEDDLAAWAQRLAATGWSEIYVFFMHEPTAPAYAQGLMRHFD